MTQHKRQRITWAALNALLESSVPQLTQREQGEAIRRLILRRDREHARQRRLEVQ